MIKELILKYLYLLYRYYDKGSTKSIAYFSAMCFFIFVLYLNVQTISLLLGIEKVGDTSFSDKPKSFQYFVAALIFVPVMFILQKLFKKEDVLKIEMSKRSIKIGNIIILLYLISSMLILTLVIQNN